MEGFAMVIRASETHGDLTAGILDEKQPELTEVFKQTDRLWGPESRRRESWCSGFNPHWLRQLLPHFCCDCDIWNLHASIAGPVSAAQDIDKKPKPNFSSFVSSAWDAVLERAQTLADSSESAWKPRRPLDDGRFDQNKHSFCNQLPVFPFPTSRPKASTGAANLPLVNPANLMRAWK